MAMRINSSWNHAGGDRWNAHSMLMMTTQVFDGLNSKRCQRDSFHMNESDFFYEQNVCSHYISHRHFPFCVLFASLQTLEFFLCFRPNLWRCLLRPVYSYVTRVYSHVRSLKLYLGTVLPWAECQHRHANLPLNIMLKCWGGLPCLLLFSMLAC